MDTPKDPPTNLSQPSNLLNPAVIRLNPKLIDHTSPSDSGVNSPINPATEDVFFGARAVDQAALEREVASKADQAILEGANEDDQRRLGKATTEKAKHSYMLDVAQERYNRPTTVASEKKYLLQQINELKQKITQYNDDIEDITQRMLQRDEQVKAMAKAKTVTDQRLPDESDREFLIRTGKITPFDNIPGLKQTTIIQDFSSASPSILRSETITAQNLRRPGFDVKPSVVTKDQTGEHDLSSSGLSSLDSDEEDISSNRKIKRRKLDSEDDDYEPEHNVRRRLVRKPRATESALESPEDSDSDYYVGGDVAIKRKLSKKASKDTDSKPDRLDDGDEKLYQKRLKEWMQSRRYARGQNTDEENQHLDEWQMPHPTIPDEVLSRGDFRVPGDIHPSLFPYQKVCVQWLWELHCQKTGGILSDEMGLGKTVMIISFIAGLHYSDMLDKPCIIVAPGAVLSQWASEFHLWWPALRVAILHKSGSGMLLARSDDVYDDNDSTAGDSDKPSKRGKFAAKKIVDRVFKHGHILITTYEGLTTYGDILLEKEWEYAILDEGHKIRNPDAKVSLNCKQLKTHHRLILSGTPIQNNLVELWSLFDFVFPGRLGTLPVFKEQFEVPIRLGGYKNAQNIQVQTATQCAVVLKQLISPYLLRRMKIDVMQDLPTKEEKVLFCKLTKGQVASYQDYLKSAEVNEILKGKRDSLSGISVLRKICCHPDLVDRERLQNKPGYDYGNGLYSGKMQVMKKMLLHWKSEGHRVLLFSQGVQVLDILEKNIRNYEGFKYIRMDGSTLISQRQRLVDEFNNDAGIDVFLLTTRVGGLGLNLTGADRVIIFDPDWNPSTDLQARERAWRIGQTKPVSIFRLIAAGTIEEKMYNRQLFKQHLSQKVLNNPNQSRFFHSENLRDLFTFGPTSGGTSTGAMFHGAETVYTSFSVSSKKEDSTLQNIDGVTSLQNYALKDEDPSKETGERKFIEEIFSSSGVLSSLEHEHLVGAASKDMSTNGKYAAQIAEGARKRLEESVQVTQAVPIGTVTWTGRSGTAGKHESPKRASASALLGKLKGKAVDVGGRKGSSLYDRVNVAPPAPEGPLRPKMLHLFEQKGGSVTTEAIKDWCRARHINQRNLDKAAEMKKVLREIAKLDKATHTWWLKPQIE
ncbi:SNF2 family N-terminal domain-containing protein [Trichophaea hybrida]|nr:SNF2 family N-terminal domain-containing protein [Trichophaea hybrida]